MLELRDVTVELPTRIRSEGFAFSDPQIGGPIVTKRGASYIRALQSVSLTVDDGEVVGVVGLNGSGKTTLLRVAAGIIHPSAGSVERSGHVISLLNLSVGMDANISGIANAKILSYHFRIAHLNFKEIISELDDFSELGSFLEQPIRVYSSGMRMRYLLGLATLARPDILIMDEWLAAGDNAFRNKAYQRVERLLKKAGRVLIATHSWPLINNWAKSVIWLDRGRVAQLGKASDIIDPFREHVLKHSKL